MRKLLLFVGVLVLLVGVSQSLSAQLDPGFRIYLIEEGVRVGEVFVPERAADAVTYEEHWVLYPSYKYPGPRNLRGLTIQADPSAKPYRDANDFFRRVPFAAGSKYVHVTATESLVKRPILR